MLGGSHTGYARLTRRWWTPVSAELDREGLTERPAVLRQLEHAQPRQHRHRHRPRPRGRARELRRDSCPTTTSCARSWPLFREGHSQGSWDNFLYFVARIYFAAKGADGMAERRDAEQASGRHPPAQHDGAAGARAGPAAGVARSRMGWIPRVGDVDADALAASRRGDRQHRLSARRRRLQHPARGRGRPRRAARRVRPGQGGHAQRRRRRRDDLERRARRALGVHLLARQRVQRRRPRPATCASAPGWTTSGR